ncbi:MAG: hypothetical protein GXY83_27785 [Rhodopirellula sp.]|nr:hypothetical protein [Rhodopirellula sp.]
MTKKLDWDDLRRKQSLPGVWSSPSAASEVVRQLGGLARWCLKPELLRLAAENDAIPPAYRDAWRTRPQLPATHGSCSVVFATHSQDRLPLMRPAFALPLRWVQGQKHSPRLPAALVQLATEVAAMFPAHHRIRGCEWGLQPGEELGDTDLSDMPLAGNSGWASLAAGLLVAAEGGTPDPQVWATGSWDHRSGVQCVEFLKEKLDLAIESGVKVFFVPFAQADEARGLRGDIEIGVLRMAEREPSRALAELALRLETPPPPPSGPDEAAEFDRCVAYYLKRPRGRPSTTQFYWSHLLPTITRRCRSQVLSEYPGWQPTHLVTIVSGSPELVPLAARALDVTHCLLLYTPSAEPLRDQTRAMQMVKQLLEADGRACVPGPFEDNRSLEYQIPDVVRRFGQGQPPESLVLDLTPGNKWMTWVADRAMLTKSWRVYVRNDTLTAADRRVRPGSERLICWQI